MFSTPIGPKTCSGLTCTDSAQFKKKIPKIIHGGSRSPKYLEFGHFALLFCRGRHLAFSPLGILPEITRLIIKITISSIVIGLKTLLFSTNSLANSCQVVIGQFVIGHFVIGQFNRPITFEVVVQINQSHSKL